MFKHGVCIYRFLGFYFSDFYLVLGLIEKMYQTLKTLFHHISRQDKTTLLQNTFYSDDRPGTAGEANRGGPGATFRKTSAKFIKILRYTRLNHRRYLLSVWKCDQTQSFVLDIFFNLHHTVLDCVALY